MDEAPTGLVEYVLVTAQGETKNSSVEYTGKGKATYPNGDVYEGEFVDGVSISFYSCDTLKAQKL